MPVVASFLVPPYPHVLQVPDANPGYRRLRDAYGEVAKQIEALKPDLLLLYSTQWLSVIGHQVQARKEATWTHVDQEWHELGAIPYTLRFDPDFGAEYVAKGEARGLEMRTVDYHGFPIDTGSVVALQLLDPKGKIPASIVSCNMYADRSETLVLGKAAKDAIGDKRVVAVAVTALSNRVFTGDVPFEEDRIHSQKDDEWNEKYLEILGEGRLEDASQLARTFSAEANGDQRMKALWWLAALSGQHNRYDGTVYAYESVYGAGCALVGLVPTQKQAMEAEYDEDDAELYHGDRNVLGGASAFESPEARLEREMAASAEGETTQPRTSSRRHSAAPVEPAQGGGSVVVAKTAPRPVGAYPHARQVGDMLYLSGLGPRDPQTNAVPGGPVWDDSGTRQVYDIEAQTEQVIENMKTVLASCGASIDDVVDVTCYLIDMDRDFVGFNTVYTKHFQGVQAARTTLEINRLPTPIAVEFKVIAKAP